MNTNDKTRAAARNAAGMGSMKMKRLNLAMAVAGCLMATMPGFSRADDLSDMKALLQKMQLRIEQLEAQKATAPAPAAAATSPSFLGNSNVTLYGKIDVFGEYDTQGSKGSRVALDSGGLNGTRWGIKGGSDISDGLRAVFQLEGGIFINNGLQAQGGRLFGRQAYAGVEGKYGRVTAGRQYSPMYNAVTSYDPYEQGYGSPTTDGNVSTGATRYDSSLIYSSPKINGFSASVMAAPGGNTGNRHGAEALALNYGCGPLGLTVAVQKVDHVASATSEIKSAFVGASYQLMSTKLMGGIGRVSTDPDVGARTHRREWMIGSASNMTRTGKLLLAYGQGETENAAPRDKGRVVTAGWVESLNPVSRVYGILSSHKNDAGASLVPQGTSSSGSYSINPGDSALGLALGFQYDF